MKVITARVVNGMVELPPEVADGTTVAVLAPDTADGFRLTSEQEQELAAALAEVRAGDFVDGDALLAELRGQQPS